jgi:hypothetical protein
MKTIAQQLNVTDFPFVIKDKNNNEIYFENSSGYWWKQEFDENNNRVYYENLSGTIRDNRTKPTPEFTMEELISKLGYNFKIKK